MKIWIFSYYQFSLLAEACAAPHSLQIFLVSGGRSPWSSPWRRPWYVNNMFCKIKTIFKKLKFIYLKYLLKF